MQLTEDRVARITAAKYGDLAAAGWGPRLRSAFGYFTPDDWYEACLDALVGPQTRWLDVGCGRDIVPFSPIGSRALADRCELLTGIDPSDNIDHNPFLDVAVKSRLEDYRAARPFDLITLRMVAEHITEPGRAVAALQRLCAPGGAVLIYTVDKWSPVSLLAACTPMSFHHRAKNILWESEERDSFPTIFLMNTRGVLRDLMASAGFQEESFMALSDTRTTNRFRPLNVMELLLWRALRAIGMNYPEQCLLGLYKKR